MTIDEIISSAPVPKDPMFLNSTSFLKVLYVKYARLHSLINETDDVVTIESELSDLESAEPYINDTDNLLFLKYVIGMKFAELGLKYKADRYLSKGISKLEDIDEERLSSDDLKADFYRLFSTTILNHYQNEIKKDDNYRYSFKNLEPLLKAKYFLFRIYNMIIEKKIILTTIREARVISDLITNLVFLSRWNEPFYILEKRTSVTDYNPKYTSFLKGHILNEIAWYTCCSIYPAMMYEVKRYIRDAASLSNEDQESKDNLIRITKEADSLIENHKLDLKEFEKNYGNTKKDFEEHTNYRKWILKNHMSLCEHAVFCFCGLSKSDNLSIKSEHEHTNIEWVDQFEVLLDKIKGEYNIARHFLFLAENESQLIYNRTDEVEISRYSDFLLNNSDSDYLLQAFKSTYSILDKIGRAIYSALDIEQKDIYFHNCWKRIKGINFQNHNRYLYTLYSIACDLSDTSKYSAFQEYKKWRNLMEHEYFYLVKDVHEAKKKTEKLSIIKEVVQIDEFREKTFYMLQLCRSAIFSFAFFIRHESKHKSKIQSNCK